MKERGGSAMPWKYTPRTGAPATWSEAAKESWETARQYLGKETDALSPRREARLALDKQAAKEIFETKGFFSRFKKQAKAAIVDGVSDQAIEAIEMLGKKARPLGMVSNTLLRFALPALGFYALTGGFAAAETPEELRDLYVGRQYVPVKKGRWWEMGGTPYEGTNIKYWKPHWYRQIMTRAHDKALWGAEEDEYSPLYKLFAEEFTYELEKRNYYSRPYPVTDQALADVPFVGWLLAPIGRLIKPARPMHVEDLQRGGQVADLRSSIEANPVEWLGGMAPQRPVSPYAGTAQFGKTAREWGDQAGLVGWAASMMLEQYGGSDSFFAKDRWLESASRMSSFERDFWEAEVGGGFFLSEPLRRFIPKHRREIDLYNPIPNNMPKWIPAHLRFGDPMGRIDQGELLFPGPGYAALYPEVAGVAPDQYPLIHRYNILSNIAPWSAEFRRTASALEKMEGQGMLSTADLDFVNRINERLRRSAVRREFMRDVNETEGLGIVGRGLGSAYRATLSGVRRVFTPLEYMAPFGFRPVSKLLPQGPAIDEYEQNRVYGTELSFWNKPWRDWFRPAIYSAAHSLGWDGIPEWRQDSRNMLEYFDKLEYHKWNMLSQRAAARGDKANARQYEGLRERTLYGVNPYSDLRTVLKAVPYEEKDYFVHFARERDPGDRERILQMVPQYMQHIYIAQWEKIDMVDTENDKILEHMIAQKNAMETKRQAELDSYFEMNPLPRPDWIGFNPAVDLDDVKLKIVQQRGADIHDYGLWESRERMLARKPYINDEVVDQMFNDDPTTARRKVYNTLRAFGIPDADIRVSNHLGSASRNDVMLNYADSRETEIERLFGRFF
jgi:hypothetical protein